MLDWLSSGKGTSLPELLAKKKYAQAIALLQDELKRRPHDERTQMQLAEVYVLEGKNAPAVKILTALADDLAERGFAAKAIAVLKKVQKLDPGQHVEQKLARMIRDSRGEPSGAHASMPSMGAAIDLGIAPIPESPRPAAPPAPKPAPPQAAPLAKPAPAPPPPKPKSTPLPVEAPVEDFAIGVEPMEDFAIGMSVDETPAFMRATEPEIAEAPVIDYVEPEPEPEPVIDFVAPEPEPEPVIDFAPEPEPVIDFAPEPEPVIDFAPEPEPVIDFAPEPAAETVPDFFVEETPAEEVPVMFEPEPEPVRAVPQPAERTGDVDADLFAALPDDDGMGSGDAIPAEPMERPTQKKIALFADFTNDDLAVVIQELDLQSFSPGDIIYSEGQAGDSLYVIASGAVKTYVRQPDNTNMLSRELAEGDFFGEIALFTGKPRTGTVIAASPCDLLQLNKAALDRISVTHPNVRQVLMKFYDERAHSAMATAVQEIEIEEETQGAEAPVVVDETPLPVTVETPIVVPEVSDEEQQQLRAISLHDAALEATRAAQWSAALPLWREYIDLKPDDLQAMSVIGIVSGKLELWEESADAFRLAVKHSPKDATLYFNLGFAYGKMAQWPEAIYAYEQAVRLKPDYDKARQSLARAQAQMKK